MDQEMLRGLEAATKTWARFGWDPMIFATHLAYDLVLREGPAMKWDSAYLKALVVRHGEVLDGYESIPLLEQAVTRASQAPERKAELIKGLSAQEGGELRQRVLENLETWGALRQEYDEPYPLSESSHSARCPHGRQALVAGARAWLCPSCRVAVCPRCLEAYMILWEPLSSKPWWSFRCDCPQYYGRDLLPGGAWDPSEEANIDDGGSAFAGDPLPALLQGKGKSMPVTSLRDALYGFSVLVGYDPDDPVRSHPGEMDARAVANLLRAADQYFLFADDIGDTLAEGFGTLCESLRSDIAANWPELDAMQRRKGSVLAIELRLGACHDIGSIPEPLPFLPEGGSNEADAGMADGPSWSLARVALALVLAIAATTIIAMSFR